MNLKMATGLMSALLLAGTTSLAATPAHNAKIQAHTKMEIPATVKVTAHLKPVSKMAIHTISTSKSMMHKAWNTNLRKAAWKGPMATVGDREVNALNALEAAGYRTFMHMHPSGTSIAVQAMKGGKEYSLNVAPSGKITRQT